MLDALNAGDVTKIGVGVILVLVVLGFLLALVVTAIVGRVVLALVIVVLAIFVWTQRTSVENKIHQHNCNLTFFGVHLDAPASIKKYC